MSVITSKTGKSKTDKTPFLKFFTSDWSAGTRGMNFEEKGFYLEFLICQWNRKDALPNCDRWLAGALQCNPRTVRKLKASLIALGKLKTYRGFICNPRMLKDIQELGFETNSTPIGAEFDANSTPIGAEFDANSSRIGAELEPNAAKNPTITTRARAPVLIHIQKSDTDSEPRNSVLSNNKNHHQQTRERAPEVAADDASRKIDPHDLYNRLVDAANGSLYPLALGLQAVSEPLGWIEQGADLEKDILPVIKAVGHRARPQTIRSWSYFGPMISQAVENRKRGLPAVKTADADWRKPETKPKFIRHAGLV